FPWAVFAVNVTGCALIGVLMVLLAERGTVTHPLVRPFLGVGVLGGFTTFSTYAASSAPARAPPHPSAVPPPPRTPGSARSACWPWSCWAPGWDCWSSAVCVRRWGPWTPP
ncbi:fluoride efflux transporter FluC, partial [Streptomyces sp. wa22]|uniref:fluoride efflux transporter FluC n=1 Tax=Streptomyces sp. wa22 TaxID=1828244 RepID=UPI0021C9EBCD